MKFDMNQHGHNMQSIAKKLEEMEAAIRSNEDQMVQTAARERQARNDLLHSLREAVNSDQDRLRSLLESKITHTVQAEARERQDHLSSVLTTIDSVLKNTPGMGSPPP